ncbi:MAG TPA: cation diffusion facilitator family transporter [Pseudomonadota bacterium]|jgi:cation diffusion facilitator family transporter|nr:cation diffusion facilitator family transporter [Pseudomonadota bacterium]HNF95798.1 cation diffusion facilitator family transporter [Pseudomonadota bacterium]HNI59607.1 cation diffusion facilitator family transporter [Pseudomonadota bacterium]HNK46229.1 cation diffusion facilitator family transporter [Pseudomonadota bacterium]HNN49750.1 cation diffusion facilitator family transporter [Pseudomonadota bacterium]
MSESKPPVEPSHGGGLRVVLVALCINLLIAVFKFVAAGISGSTAMLAEAVHSLADTANQVFLLIGMKRSSRPPDARHPFGYGTETYFWAFIVAGSIFLIGAAVSIWEGSEKLWHILHGQPIAHGNIKWAVIVLSVSLVLEGWSLRAALQEFKHMTAGKGLRKTVEDARDPTVLTVLFEDMAALFGLFAALVGVVLSYVTGNLMFDALASIVVGVALLVVALFLGRDSMSLLIGEAVPKEEHEQIVALAAAHPGILQVIHLRTKHIAPQEVLATFKIRFARDLTMDGLEAKINDLEAELRAKFPHLRRIYIEPGFDEATLRKEQGIPY